MGDVKTFPDVAVLVPCYNEEKTVARVVRDFRSALPEAKVYVYDNCCTDKTAEAAESAGAIVKKCNVPGKGAVVRKMFEELQEPKCIMVDGDSTYPARYARKLLAGLSEYDMVLGDRLSVNYYADNVRSGHGFGNFLVKFLVNLFFRGHVKDIMTGYRAFTYDFAKSVHLEKDGFEVETEMTIWALQNHKKIGSVPIHYNDRPDGSKSKVNTVKDGIKVVLLIFEKRFRRH